MNHSEIASFLWGVADLIRDTFKPALCPGVNRRTLQRDLKTLVEKHLLAEHGTGPTDPTRHYRLGNMLRRAAREL